MSTSGGRSETDMNAFAVMPCTCSPTRVVSTVTPVANMPSVLRKAIAGSPSSPSPSSSASADGATSNDVPNASGAAIALADRDLELRWASSLPLRRILTTRTERGGRGRPSLDRSTRVGPSPPRELATCSSGIVGVSSRQCGVSLSCTIRRKRKSRSEMHEDAEADDPLLRAAVDPPAPATWNQPIPTTRRR